jgi:mRNA interferase HigB
MALREWPYMHIISKKKLREFWTEHLQAQAPLETWHRVVEHSHWETFNDVRATFGSADLVGRFVVFNIAGNNYRLIAAIHFNRGKVFVRHVLTHAEYDQGKWKEA